jgi:ABC-type nitrate/sulfonate/bicarbonate transport system substrate-binding protein
VIRGIRAGALLAALLGLAACGGASAQPPSSAPAQSAAARPSTPVGTASANPAAAPSSSTSSTTPKPAGSAAASGKPAASAAAKPQTDANGKPLTRIIEALPTRDFGYLPSIVADAKGFFAESGLQVEMPVMASQAAIPALTNKQVQFAAHGSAERAAYQGAPLKGIWYAWNVNTFYAISAKDVKSYKDLKGKVIGIASPGSSEDVVIHLLLKKEGISPNDLQIAPMGGGPQRAQAMIGGQAQFTVMNPDIAVDLEQRGFNILGSMADILPVPWSGFGVHQDTIRDQPDMLKGWLRAQIKAQQFIKQNAKETADIAVKELQLSPAVAQKAVGLLQPAISDDDPGGLTEAGLILNAQVDQDSIKLAGDPLELGKKVNDLTLLRQVQRDMGIRCTKGFQCQ